MPKGFAPLVKTSRVQPSLGIPVPEPKPKTNIHYPMFFFGAVIISVIMFFIRERNRNITTGPGLVVEPGAEASIAPIENLSQRIVQEVQGSFVPSNL